MNAIQKLIQTARGEIGYLEKKTNSSLDHKTNNAGYNNWNKYARDLDATNWYHAKKNGYSWCDIFVDWCFVTAFGYENALKLTCQPERSYGAGCTESAKYYMNNKRFFKSNPQPGDQIFFTKDGGKTFYHTGIVEKVANNKVYTIEGNTSSSSGVVANGGAVRDKSYSVSYSGIGGYGRPDYSIIDKTSTTTTSKTGIVTANSGLRCMSEPDKNSKYVGALNYNATVQIHAERENWYKVTGTSGWGNLSNVWVNKSYIQVTGGATYTAEPPDANTPPYAPDSSNSVNSKMTDSEFSKLFNSFRNTLRDNNASSYSKEAREWAIANNLVTGNGKTDSNGDPNYMWEDFLTREQFVTVLYRFAKTFGLV